MTEKYLKKSKKCGIIKKAQFKSGKTALLKHFSGSNPDALQGAEKRPVFIFIYTFTVGHS